MFRRSFLSSLGVLPFFGFVKTKDKENPKGLPVAKFDEYGNLINFKELLQDKDKCLIFVNEKHAVVDIYESYWGEISLNKPMRLKNANWNLNPELVAYFDKTENSKIRTNVRHLIWAKK